MKNAAQCASLTPKRHAWSVLQCCSSEDSRTGMAVKYNGLIEPMRLVPMELGYYTRIYTPDYMADLLNMSAYRQQSLPSRLLRRRLGIGC